MYKNAHLYGIRVLRSLGLRINELTQLLPHSPATIKRYTRTMIPEYQAIGRTLEHVMVPSRITLTAYWVAIIAQNRPLAPPTNRPFLDTFCPICLTRPTNGAGREEDAAERGVNPDHLGAIMGLTPTNLNEAFSVGWELCKSGVSRCASGPARFAILCLTTRVRPWHAAQFLFRDVAPERYWRRNCLKCDKVMITQSSAYHLCPAHTSKST